MSWVEPQVILAGQTSCRLGVTPRCSLPAGLWQSVHIDDLRRSKDMISDLTALQNLTISQVFSEDAGAARGELCVGERGSCGPRLGTAGTDAWHKESDGFPCSAPGFGGSPHGSQLVFNSLLQLQVIKQVNLVFLPSFFLVFFLTKMWHLHC